MASRQVVTEADLRKLLQERKLNFPPLRIEEVQTISPTSELAEWLEVDTLLTLRWRERSYYFIVEIKRLWTPKVLSEAVHRVSRWVSRSGPALRARFGWERIYPFLLVPYLSEEWLVKLEGEGVSGVDLCGNGVVVADDLLVMRTGFPNRFRWKTTIKNVYRKNSSIAARTFLLVPRFNSVNEVLEEIRKRGGEVTLPTVSKVCKSLEDDLVLERVRRTPALRLPRERPRTEPALRLLQPEKLLDLLAENYAPPVLGRTFKGKCSLRPEELRARLAAWEEGGGGRVVLTGASSVEAYAVMAREPMQSFYCSDLDGAVRSLGDDLRETERFANVTLLETRDAFVYFDRRPDLWASPIQSYLELVAGDKRERETAEQVRRAVLGPRVQTQGKG